MAAYHSGVNKYPSPVVLV